MLGIVQHRAKADAAADYANGSMGYLREKDVIALVEALGFELVAMSEINANPKDPANHPDGVWSLPPTYTLGDKNRAAFAAIGESDRMTLLFRKRE
jgi:predicted methyltransferase